MPREHGTVANSSANRRQTRVNRNVSVMQITSNDISITLYVHSGDGRPKLVSFHYRKGPNRSLNGAIGDNIYLMLGRNIVELKAKQNNKYAVSHDKYLQIKKYVDREFGRQFGTFRVQYKLFGEPAEGICQYGDHRKFTRSLRRSDPRIQIIPSNVNNGNDSIDVLSAVNNANWYTMNVSDIVYHQFNYPQPVTARDPNPVYLQTFANHQYFPNNPHGYLCQQPEVEIEQFRPSIFDEFEILPALNETEYILHSPPNTFNVSPRNAYNDSPEPTSENDWSGLYEGESLMIDFEPTTNSVDESLDDYQLSSYPEGSDGDGTDLI